MHTVLKESHVDRLQGRNLSLSSAQSSMLNGTGIPQVPVGKRTFLDAVDTGMHMLRCIPVKFAE